MGIYAMGASSSANKETRALKLKAYLDTTTTKDYSSLVALEKSGANSWTTFLSYLGSIKHKFGDTLTKQGKANFEIAEREAKLLKKVNARARRHRMSITTD